jgi:hypothetical protein
MLDYYFHISTIHSILVLTFKGNKQLFYITKLCLLGNRNLPKLTSEMQVSFVNEAPDIGVGLINCPRTGASFTIIT